MKGTVTYMNEKINVINRKIFYANRRVIGKQESCLSDCVCDIFKSYHKFVMENLEVKYAVDTIPISCTEKAKNKWTGAQYINDMVYGIPNSAATFIQYHMLTKHAEYVGNVGREEFKWTGGAIWEERIYAFPRSSNVMLGYLPSDGSFITIKTKEKYIGEHHYGGVCSEEGIVYQPPRNTDHILVWDLNKRTSRLIRLAAVWRKLRVDYCASLIHPNGFIYFFPLNGRIIKMDLITEEWAFIGGRIRSGAFEVKIACDGNIYGFNSENGILKVSVVSDEVEVMYKDEFVGAYGTKLGLNGKLYSIPGKGRYIWEYSPLEDKLAVIYDTGNLSSAKYAGGVTLPHGDIIGVPENEVQILVLRPESKSTVIPNEIYQKFWVDCY